jgi:hypothetical protein
MLPGTGIAEVRAAQAPRLSLKREIARYTEAASSYERNEANIDGRVDGGDSLHHSVGADDCVRTKGQQQQSAPERGAESEGARQATTEQ